MNGRGGRYSTRIFALRITGSQRRLSASMIGPARCRAAKLPRCRARPAGAALGRVHRLAGGGFQPGADRLGQAGRGEHGAPIVHCIAGQAGGLRHGRHARHQRAVLRREVAQRAQPAGLHQLVHRRERGGDQLDLAADAGGHRRAGAAVVHMGQLAAGHGVHQLGADMGDGAEAGGAVVQQAGAAAADLHHLRQVFRLQLGAAADQRRRQHDLGDGGEVALQVEGQLGIDELVDHDRVEDGDDGVAIGRRLRDRLGADVAAGAGAVLRHHGRPAPRSSAAPAGGRGCRCRRPAGRG